METYYTKVDVQADRWVAEVDKPTIIVKNKEMTKEKFNKRRGCWMETARVGGRTLRGQFTQSRRWRALFTDT